MMTIVAVLMIFTGVFYFGVYMKKCKDHKQKDIGYRIVFGSIFLLLSVPIINTIMTGS
ncbi:hypothetical protein [Bacillus sp. NPDC077027]|uniref:hypothetical protein n=1 Tax=Bacillus sp. NPDC077027 TaxID=3390548 RepID=UPI003D04620D